MEHSIMQQLFKENFPPSDKESWRKAAMSELDGREPITSLAWKDEDQLTFLPYYNHEDVANADFIKFFKLNPSKTSFSGNRAWLNMPCVLVDDEQSSNKRAITHLSHGADGILFDCLSKSSVNFESLLQNIELRYCGIAFRARSSNFLNDLSLFIEKTSADIHFLSGNLFWEEIPQTGKNIFVKRKNFRSFGVWIQASTPAKEIHDALVSGVECIEKFKNENTLEEIFSNISFSLPLHTNFLGDISKLKALRLLWFQIANAYGLNSYDVANLHIHAYSALWKNENFQPHGNMLKSTTAAMSAISGGTDSMTIFAEDNYHVMMNRIAGNVSNILREESHFDKVADPFAGAYAIDVMVKNLAENVWSMFQSTMKK
jgi:methylmalonyl-CoA mutase